MKIVTLLRHAKSSWSDSELSDHDRPLNKRGLHDAPVMRERLYQQSNQPDRILCSSAKRTRETLGFFLPPEFSAAELNIVSAPADCPDSTVAVCENLYLASAGTLLDSIQQTHSSVKHLMIIAHNPGIEMLCKLLHADAPKRMPTAAICQFCIHNDSFEIQPDTVVDLLYHDYPKK